VVRDIGGDQRLWHEVEGSAARASAETEEAGKNVEPRKLGGEERVLWPGQKEAGQLLRLAHRAARKRKRRGVPLGELTGGPAQVWGPVVRGRGREWQVGPAAIQIKFEII
jgi:hypothetical protein